MKNLKIGSIPGIRLAALAAVLPLALASGCGGGGGSSSTGKNIQVTGTLTGVTLAANETWADKLLAAFLPNTANAMVSMIDNVIAIDTSKNLTFATKNPSTGGFSLDLASGKAYLIAFMNGPDTIAVYVADPVPGNTGWSVLPVSRNASNLDLGSVSLVGGKATGTTSSTSVASALGLSTADTQVLGVWNAAMQRLSSLDVDGNGTIDALEGKYYDLTVHYEFDPATTFATLSSAPAYTDETLTTYVGYGYWFHGDPGNVDWTSVAGATLTPPSYPINEVGGTSHSSAITQCYNNPTRGSIDFFCGSGNESSGLAASPATPPSGTYVVTVGGSQSYEFSGVSSQTLTSHPDNVYIPSVQLTMSGGKVTAIACKWYKHDPSSGNWVQPTNTELASVVGNIRFEIGEANWVGTNRTSGNIPVTADSTVPVPSQGFNPGVLRINYMDNFGYGYGIEWR